jgi:DNA/RNA-binding domain of Phe-tRNA-synthetase-like protein
MIAQRNIIIDPEIKKTGLTGIFISVENIVNKENDTDFEQHKKKYIFTAYNYASQLESLKSDYFLNGFRRLHESVGASNRKYTSAPETLYKILLRNRDIPRINLLVDIYNLISISYRLALGAHDWEKIQGNVHLRFTNGNEKFIPLGETQPKAVEPELFSYIDENDEVICYLDVKQCEKTKVTLDTKNVFIVIQGNDNTPFAYIENAVAELIFLIKKYCGGTAKVIGQIEDLFHDYQI